ncbi:MAG: peptide chain release factor N(5)-glutamine methyltransferase [Actinomycetota bacterium]
MRPADVVRRGADYLARHDVDPPMPTAEVLLASVLDTDRGGIYTRVEPLRGHEARAYGRALCRRCAGEPVQHITGETGFRRLTLIVRPGVFVPRPETEAVVDAALDVVRDVHAPEVVDVGTGTGAIALAIKDERPDARVCAVDRSPEAVRLARENAARSGLDVEVLEGDLLLGLAAAGDLGAPDGDGHGAPGPFDLVVSNPPYIEPGAYEGLPREVRADPVEALIGGLGVHARLFAQAPFRLRSGGAVVVEIGETQTAAVTEIARAAAAASVQVRPDLAGRDRVVVARWP